MAHTDAATTVQPQSGLLCPCLGRLQLEGGVGMAPTQSGFQASQRVAQPLPNLQPHTILDCLGLKRAPIDPAKFPPPKIETSHSITRSHRRSIMPCLRALRHCGSVFLVTYAVLVLLAISQPDLLGAILHGAASSADRRLLAISDRLSSQNSPNALRPVAAVVDGFASKLNQVTFLIITSINHKHSQGTLRRVSVLEDLLGQAVGGQLPPAWLDSAVRAVRGDSRAAAPLFALLTRPFELGVRGHHHLIRQAYRYLPQQLAPAYQVGVDLWALCLLQNVLLLTLRLLIRRLRGVRAGRMRGGGQGQ